MILNYFDYVQSATSFCSRSWISENLPAILLFIVSVIVWYEIVCDKLFFYGKLFSWEISQKLCKIWWTNECLQRRKVRSTKGDRRSGNKNTKKLTKTWSEAKYLNLQNFKSFSENSATFFFFVLSKSCWLLLFSLNLFCLETLTMKKISHPQWKIW